MTNRYSALIGSAPARSLGDVSATLIRLRKMFDLDDEDLASRGYEARLVMHTRLELFDALIDYLAPAVAAQEAWEDRIDVEAKEPRLALDQPLPQPWDAAKPGQWKR